MALISSLEIGTLAFFVFSFCAGVFILLQAIFWSAKDTGTHRTVKGVIGVVYAVITVLAFFQLEGGVKSPYVDIGKGAAPTQQFETTYSSRLE